MLRRCQSLGEIPGLVARSAAMRQVVDLARRTAKVESTVLITGESGVGKEVIAHLIHEESARLGGPFVDVNCAAVPEGLLESELFGHARGAFTGAAQDRPGLFEAAKGGTVLLDEIGELPIAMQPKLLRVLQERAVRRVGENHARPIDVRIVAATNRDLAGDVVAKRFRQDLYYRLRVIEIRVPPLRDRRDDVLPLAHRFVTQAAERLDRPISGFTLEAANRLVTYAWPGNVRELENAVERAVALANGRSLDLDDLPEELLAPCVAVPTLETVRPLADIERDYILGVVRAAGENKAHAARLLGIGPATLFRKLKQYSHPARTPACRPVVLSNVPS